MKITFEELLKEYKKLGIEPQRRVRNKFMLTEEMIRYIEKSFELKLKRDVIGMFICKKYNLNYKPITIIKKYWQYKKQLNK